MFTRIVYISHISEYDRLSSRSGPDNMGLKRTYSFIRKFYIFMSFFFSRKPLKKAKAERPQVNKAFALLMINYIYVRQMGPTDVRSHEQSVPHKLSHALT